MVVLLNVFRRMHPRKLNDRFRRLQVVSAAFMAFSHGSNDAQKTMGIMTLALIAGGVLPHDAKIPLWVILLAASAMSLGTAAGGWRIIRTMGQRVVKLDPVHGFAAETTAATIILDGVAFGMPVSTTHVISSAIMGVGVERPLLGGPLGRRRQHRRRLGPDDSGDRLRRRGSPGSSSAGSSDGTAPRRDRHRPDARSARRPTGDHERQTGPDASVRFPNHGIVRVGLTREGRGERLVGADRRELGDDRVHFVLGRGTEVVRLHELATAAPEEQGRGSRLVAGGVGFGRTVVVRDRT